MIRKYGKLIGYLLCGFGALNLIRGIISMINGVGSINDLVLSIIGTVLWAACGILFIVNDKKIKEEEEKLKKRKKKEKSTFTTKSNKKKIK